MSIISPSGQSSAPAAGSPQGSAPDASAGNQTPPTASWRDALPEDLRGHAAIQSYKDIGSLVKSHISAQSMIGADKIVLPGKDATPEQLGEFYKRLGRPEKPEEYVYKLPEGLKPENTNGERLKAWQARLHDMGLTKAQGERLLTEYIQEEHSTITAANKAREDQIAADEMECKKAFGAKYDENINFVRLALNQFGNDDLYAAIDKAGLGNNPAFVKAFADIGRTLAGEGSPRGFGGSSSGGGVATTPETAQAELSQLHANPEMMKALFDRSHPQHAAVVQRRAELFKIAHPSTKDGMSG